MPNDGRWGTLSNKEYPEVWLQREFEHIHIGSLACLLYLKSCHFDPHGMLIEVTTLAAKSWLFSSSLYGGNVSANMLPTMSNKASCPYDRMPLCELPSLLVHI